MNERAPAPRPGRARRLLRLVGATLAVLLALAVVGPLVVPIPALEGTLPPEQLAGADSRFIEAGGVRLHVLAAGEGSPAVVLLHGFLASTFSWREVFDPLAARGLTLAFDRPAFGLSERPMPEDWGGVNPYGAEAQIHQTLALLDSFGVEHAALIGNSAGGALALRLALDHPERVAGLVLVDAAVYEGGGPSAWVRPLLHTPQARRLGPWALRGVRGWGLDFARAAWHDPGRLTAEVWEGYLLPLQTENWDRALWEYTLAGRGPDLSGRLGELAVPTLVLSGDDDRIVPPELSRRLAQEIPGARLSVLPACGHAPQEECPEAFLAAVLPFLEALAPPAPR